MALPAEVILERLKLKSRLRRWRALAFVLLLIAAWSLIQESAGRRLMPLDYVARIKIEGILEEDRVRQEILSEIKDDHRIKAVIVHINSPGGTVVGGEELHVKLKEVAAVKPVVTVMGTIATSAAYMVAAATDRIYARQGTITGSIGVILQTAEMTELAKKLGVTMDTIKSAPLKGTPSPFEKLSPQAVRMLQGVIDDYFSFFIDMVAESRKLPKDEILKIADGRILTGQQALNAKLVDEIGGEEEALRWLQTQRQIKRSLKIHDVELFHAEEKFEQFFSSMVKEYLIPKGWRLNGLVSLWSHNGMQ